MHGLQVEDGLPDRRGHPVRVAEYVASDGHKVDVRIEIGPSNVPTDEVRNWPKVCRQDKVSIHVTDGAKFRQTLQYGTDEHYTLYNLIRVTVAALGRAPR